MTIDRFKATRALLAEAYGMTGDIDRGQAHALDTMTLLQLAADNTKAALVAGRLTDISILERLADTIASIAPQRRVLSVRWVEGPGRCVKCGSEVIVDRDTPAQPKPKPEPAPVAAEPSNPPPAPPDQPPSAPRPRVVIPFGPAGGLPGRSLESFDHPGW